MTRCPERPRNEHAFTADWLALREPADHAARNPDVDDAFVAFAVQTPESFKVVDMGCGRGSTLRALAPKLARRRSSLLQEWTLCDADETLLEEAEHEVESFLRRKRLAQVKARYRVVDLSDRQAVAALMRPETCHAITGSALIDLVSAAWLERLADLAEAGGIALLFSLNYSGREEWLPPHECDEAVLAAFNADQRRDKGFGAALGSGAVAWLQGRLGRFGVTVGASDWHLDGAGDAALVTMLAEGIARAAETAGLDREQAARWLAARLAARSVRIGHHDIFATPR